MQNLDMLHQYGELKIIKYVIILDIYFHYLIILKKH